MSKKPSILMINRMYPPERGATGRMMQNLAHGLQQSGWDVSVLSTQSEVVREKKKGLVRKYFVKGAKKPKTAIGCFTNLRRLRRAALRLPRHDVVLTMTDPPMLALIGDKVARAKKSKHVHWSQDVYPDLFPRLGVSLPKFLYHAMHKRAVRAMNRSAHVVAIGRCMESYLKHHGVTAGALTTIPNWTDFEILAPSSIKDTSLKVPTGVAKRPEEMFRDDSPKFRVLYAGSIGRSHTMRAVIGAAELLSQHKEIEFVFVGDARRQRWIVQERDKRGLENIKLMPYQPIEKLRSIMESGDVHLVTLRDQVKGMCVPCKLYSSLTVGRPIMYVGPAGTEVDKVVTEYQAGVTVSPDDPKGLADAIYAYRTNGDIWFQTQEGALRASQDFHPNHSISKWVTLLNKIRVS